ncbi:MAG: hypothetical protein L3J22_06875 [Xanthomonadales bacterium]|nr:hypothetical protein [Xanthomonadales bacterium]
MKTLRNALKALVLIVFLLVVVACNTVKSVNQIGETTYPLTVGEWGGTWLAGDSSLVLEVKDTKTGEIEIMFIENGEIEKHTVFVRQNGGDAYMNLIDEDKLYLFAKFKKSTNQIIIWLPLEKEMKLAINNKQLEGVISEGSDVIIKSDKLSLNKYFIANKEKILFDYEEPMIFRRLNE